MNASLPICWLRQLEEFLAELFVEFPSAIGRQENRALQVLVDVVHRRPTVAGAVEVEYDLSRRKAKKVKKILEHKDISLTDTPTGRRAI